MATTIAEYFSDELIDCSGTISFYNAELLEFTHKLEVVIRRNSISGIAAKVELQQAILNNIAAKLYALRAEFKEQKASLKKDNVFVENSLINHETEKQQSKLRHKMKMAETEFVDAKFDCYNFLSGTLKA